MDGKGEVEHSENVVRLPRDWVGPPEELVPVGSRARARAREAEAEHGECIPAAADFWGEDAAAVHHAIQGPASAPDRPAVSAPVSEPVAGAPRPRRRLRGRPTFIPRTAVALGGGLLVAVVIAVMVVMHSGVLTRGAVSTPTASGSLVHFGRFESLVSKGITGIRVQTRHDSELAVGRLRRQRQLIVYRRMQRTAKLAGSGIHRRRDARTVRASAPPPPSQTVTTAPSVPTISETPVTAPVEASTAPTTTVTATATATTSSPPTSTGSDPDTHRAFGSGGLLGAGHSTGG